jgi:hypothetical protein
MKLAGFPNEKSIHRGGKNSLKNTVIYQVLLALYGTFASLLKRVKITVQSRH